MNWCWCIWHLFDVFQQNCEDMIWTTLIIVWKVLSVTFFSYLFFPACFCWKGWSLAYWQLGPFATAIGCLSRPWNMNNQDQCDLTICCPYPTVLTAFRRKAACLSSLKHVWALFCDFWGENGTRTFFHQGRGLPPCSWQLWANGAHL